jgi:hypothetical protein
MTIRGTIGAGAVLLAFATQSLGIEGLRITVQCPDVILGWPSSPEETYIVQWRATLTTNTPWVTLTNSLPADSTTNWTTFVDSGRVPSCPSGNDSMMMMSGGEASAEPSVLDSMIAFALRTSQPLVVQNDGSGVVLPLGLYPPGTDLSAFTIFDPASGESVSGAGYIVSQPSLNQAQLNDSETEEDDPEDPPPDPGFYQVVRVGAHIFGLTNGAVLSGIVPLPLEFGNPYTSGTLAEIILYNETGEPDPVGITFPNLPWEGTNHLTGTWDTTKATNGVYMLQVGADLDDGTVFLDQPVTVTVSNIICFPDPYNIGGDAIYVGAKTLYTNGTWHMDFYDDQNAHIGYLNGPIDGDGYCAWPGINGPGFSLDNTDGSGNRNPSSSYSIVITANAAGGGASRTTTNKVFIENAWWMLNTTAVVAYMQILPPGMPATLLFEMIQEVYSTEEPFHHNLLGTAELPFQIQSMADWGTVLTKLADSGNRDFFYFGHATGSSLGTSTAYFDLPAANALLGNNTDPLVATNMHPYRFVFIDGCLSADGNWPQAFGIPKVAGMTGSDFLNKRGIRPRAFLGWSSKKIIGLLGGYIFNNAHATYITTFWSKWAERNGSGGPKNNITQAIATAKAAAPEASLGMMLYGANDLVIDF